MQKERVSTIYCISVDLLSIIEKDRMHRDNRAWDSLLDNKLDGIKGVHDIKYNGHFGNYLYLNIENGHDTKETWSEIERIICEY